MNEAQLVKVIKASLEDESLAMRRLFSHHNMEEKIKNCLVQIKPDVLQRRSLIQVN